MMLRYCATLKAIRYESTSLNRIVADKSHCVIVALDSCLHFYLSEPCVLAEAASCKSCFALTLISQTRHFHMWRDMLMKYLSMKYSKSILAFQLQFGIFEAESEHFRWEKEKRHFDEWFQDK